MKRISKDNDSKGKGKKSGRIPLDMAHTIDYVFGILLSQGTRGHDFVDGENTFFFTI